MPIGSSPGLKTSVKRKRPTITSFCRGGRCVTDLLHQHLKAIRDSRNKNAARQTPIVVSRIFFGT